MSNSSKIVFDGEIVEADTPVVPATSRGLMYGDGVFETLRIYQAQTLFMSSHLERLFKGLDVLGISTPDGLEINKLRSLMFKLLKERHLLQDDAIVRLQVWRDGRRGYLPDEPSQSHFTVTATVCPDSFPHPHLVTVDRSRIPAESLPADVKLTNGINYILASREAAEKGGDDALMTTINGLLSETTIANIFWAKNKTVYTPSVDCDILPGITRDIMIQLINDHEDWKLQTGQFTLEDLFGADTVWISNSVRELLPVEKVDSYSFNEEHQLLDELKTQFHQFKKANLQPLHS